MVRRKTKNKRRVKRFPKTRKGRSKIRNVIKRKNNKRRKTRRRGGNKLVSGQKVYLWIKEWTSNKFLSGYNGTGGVIVRQVNLKDAVAFRNRQIQKLSEGGISNKLSEGGISNIQTSVPTITDPYLVNILDGERIIDKKNLMLDTDSTGQTQAVYTHKNKDMEEVEVREKHSDAEGGGYTIFIPSTGSLRDTLADRLYFMA